MSKKVWILTSEYNDYDQHGSYFEAVFQKKPDIKTLAKYFKMENTSCGYSNPMEALEFLLHIESGGGRMGTEDRWYNLEEVECK